MLFHMCHIFTPLLNTETNKYENSDAERRKDDLRAPSAELLIVPGL